MEGSSVHVEEGAGRGFPGSGMAIWAEVKRRITASWASAHQGRSGTASPFDSPCTSQLARAAARMAALQYVADVATSTSQIDFWRIQIRAADYLTHFLECYRSHGRHQATPYHTESDQ